MVANSLEILGDEDVISGDESDLMEGKTYIVRDWLEAARERLDLNGEICDEEWLVHQVECQVLRIGESQGWRKGQLKVRVKLLLEFEPEAALEKSVDASESPLDSLRA